MPDEPASLAWSQSERAERAKMVNLLSIVRSVAVSANDRRGVSSVEYAVLAVGVVMLVAGAVAAYDLSNPMTSVGSAVVSATMPPR